MGKLSKYADSFGFTQEEVSAALYEFGMPDMEKGVRKWYDGFTFGNRTDIYNPWSIINFLEEKKFSTYWANTSSNGLVGKLIRESSRDIKIIMEGLLEGGRFYAKIDEQIVFNQLDHNESAIWSLLLASGYLKAEEHTFDPKTGKEKDDAIIMEFKVYRPKKEKDLEDTVDAALLQIEEKQYAVELIERGIPKERILKYGLAFKGQECLIRTNQN